MALFRDVRPDWEANSFDHIPVVYHDIEHGVWISWPANLKDSGTSGTNIQDPTETAQKLEQLEVDLRQYLVQASCGLENYDECNHIHSHRTASFTLYRWKPQKLLPIIGNTFTIAALLPTPPVLESVTKLTPELQRLKINPIQFSRQVVLAVLDRETRLSKSISLPSNTLFFGFKRQHLSVTGVNHAWQLFVENDQSIILDYDDATGSATFQQTVERLDLLVFKSVSDVASRELQHVSGASFDVTVARASEKSSLPAYKDGSSRQQWKFGSVLVFKRPCFVRLPQQSDTYLSRPGLASASGQLARVARTVLNELQILSHAPLRNHQNIVHLFGICWDHVNTGSVYDACPILVQPCADLGNLEQYLIHLRVTTAPSWSHQCNILSQILTGLRDLHACRIVHGDIKPQNILVQSGESGEQPIIMLSDFGFSVMPTSRQEEVDVAGATKHFASPEVFRCFEEKNFRLPTAEAFASDVYSFGLTACVVILGGQDLFDAIIELQGKFDSDEVSIALDSSGMVSRQELWLNSKTDPEADDWLLPQISLLLIVEQAKYREAIEDIWGWICGTLCWSPSERLTIPQMLRCLEKLVGPLSNRSTIQSNPSPSHQLGQESQVFFFIDGLTQEFAINEISLEQKICRDLALENFQTKKHIFEDFKFKAGVLADHSPDEWPSLRLKQGLRQWVNSTYAAYQVFLCYLHGFGTQRDIAMAGKYLAASAVGGYTSALTLSVRFHESYPDIHLPAWKPDIEGIFQTTLLGFFPSISFFNLDLKVLEQLAPEKARQVRDHVDTSAFSELGEDHFDRKEHQEESFPGPDVQYQWFPKGSTGLFQKLVSQCSPDQLVTGFKSGLFPTNARNYNQETALYMCCRIGNATAMLALFEEFEWFQLQTTITTCDGRLPFHFLYCFSPEYVGTVADVLLAHGADINAVDKTGRRAIDYAISGFRDDVISLIFGLQEEPIFSVPALHTADVETATRLVSNGSPRILEECIRKAALQTKLEILSRLSQEPFESRILQGALDNLPILLKSISRVSSTDFPRVKELVKESMAGALLCGSTDILSGIVEHIIPENGFDVQSVIDLLSVAALQSHLAEFEILTTVSTNWTVHYGHSLLSTIITLAGSSQYDIAESWIQYLDKIALAKEVVNYIPSGCRPNCTRHSAHSFLPSLFASAVMNSCYEIAILLDPYVDHDTGFPTALYHVLNEPSPKTLDHIGFVMDLSIEHGKYVCYPIYNRTALQVVTKDNRLYKSPQDVTSVLETLLEYFVDAEEDLDARDSHGSTALFYAADYTCPEAVQVLLQWGADPMQELQVKLFLSLETDLYAGSYDLGRHQTTMAFTPYNYGLYQTYNLFMHTEAAGFKVQRGKPVFSIAGPIGAADDERRKKYLRQFETLAALSYKVGTASELPFLQHALPDAVLSKWKIKGLVPRTKTVRLEVSVTEDGSVSFEVWGIHRSEGLEISMHVSVMDEMTDDETQLKISHHMGKWSPGSRSVKYAMWGANDENLHLFLVKRYTEDGDEVRPYKKESDFITDPDGIEKIKKLVQRLRG